MISAALIPSLALLRSHPPARAAPPLERGVWPIARRLALLPHDVGRGPDRGRGRLGGQTTRCAPVRGARPACVAPRAADMNSTPRSGARCSASGRGTPRCARARDQRPGQMASWRRRCDPGGVVTASGATTEVVRNARRRARESRDRPPFAGQRHRGTHAEIPRALMATRRGPSFLIGERDAEIGRPTSTRLANGMRFVVPRHGEGRCRLARGQALVFPPSPRSRSHTLKAWHSTSPSRLWSASADPGRMQTMACPPALSCCATSSRARSTHMSASRVRKGPRAPPDRGLRRSPRGRQRGYRVSAAGRRDRRPGDLVGRRKTFALIGSGQ